MLLLKWMVCEWFINRNRKTEEQLHDYVNQTQSTKWTVQL